MRNALSDVAKKEGIDDSPQSIFAFLIERVRANLHVVLCMSPVGEPFRYVLNDVFLCFFFQTNISSKCLEIFLNFDYGIKIVEKLAHSLIRAS